MQAYREYQIKLKQQKQRERELLESRLKQEEEMMLVEQNYQSLQEEVDDMRKLIRKLRVKYKQAMNEINDINLEHSKEKQELFSQIKESERDVVLYRMILQALMPRLDISDINTIVSNCDYDQDSLSWNIVIP